jgi:protein O-GlcNAc transferase
MNAHKIQQLIRAAVGHHQAGRLGEAESLYQQVRRADPRNFDALHLSGVVALQQGRLAEAVDLLGRALRQSPRSAICAMRLGLALLRLGRFSEAEIRLRGAAELDPNLAEAWGHRSAALRALGRIEESIKAAERAVSLQPGSAEMREALAELLVGARGHAAAEPHFRQVVSMQPLHAVAWSNLGVCLTYLGNLSEALECIDRALALEPALHHAHAARGMTLDRLYRTSEACDSYSRAIAGQSDNWQARSARLLALHYEGAVSREAIFQEHVAFGEALGTAREVVGTPVLGSGRKLRVGFLSADLRQHSVAYFLEPLLAHLDAEQFEVCLYHDHVQVDAMSERLRARAARWSHVAGQSDSTLAAIVTKDAPDILIDLAGHTGLNRLPLLARRLAPVQATYLGYPDTTGVKTMDFRLVDAVTDPEGEAEQFHTERLLRFAPTAWSFAPPVSAPEVAPLPCRAGRGVTFGCFNNFAKVSGAMLGVWARLLATVPGSRLMLKGFGLGNQGLQAQIMLRLASAGISREQIELLERTQTQGEHLAAYGRVDVALDTFPYHGTTTTCEALWMGVPVVTLTGDRHMSRVGASLLQAVGHTEWVAGTVDDYIRIAAGMAADPAQLAGVRGVLRDEMRRSALLDHAGQAARFGMALHQMWSERRSAKAA